MDTAWAAAVVGQGKSSMDNVPRLAPHHLALQHPRAKKGSCRKREVGTRKKAKVIALILTEVTCATS